MRTSTHAVLDEGALSRAVSGIGSLHGHLCLSAAQRLDLVTGAHETSHLTSPIQGRLENGKPRVEATVVPSDVHQIVEATEDVVVPRDILFGLIGQKDLHVHDEIASLDVR